MRLEVKNAVITIDEQDEDQDWGMATYWNEEPEPSGLSSDVVQDLALQAVKLTWQGLFAAADPWDSRSNNVLKTVDHSFRDPFLKGFSERFKSMLEAE